MRVRQRARTAASPSRSAVAARRSRAWSRPVAVDDTVIAVDELPSSFHGDPADRMIIATARVHDLPLATHDDTIRGSRLVKIWKP
jgi:PIN domain nuclease of toxin-antitoxin system